jgi:acetolactate synthase-1/3 small subunit
MPSHTISVQVENEFGVLARVVGLFSSRGFNIESLTVNEDPLDPTQSRIVVVSSGDDQVLEQVNKQLNKLVSVIKVTDFQEVATIDRELMLVKVAVEERMRSELNAIVQAFRAHVVDIGPKAQTIEITGDADKLKAFIELVRPLGIKEIVRTGKIALARSVQVETTNNRNLRDGIQEISR